MKRWISLLLAGTLLTAALPMASAATYSDVPSGSWAASSIQKAGDAGLMQGVGNGKFGYGKVISRGEFVTILVRMFGWNVQKTGAFTDTAGNWAESYIDTAAAHDVVDAGGAFRPQDTITRQEMAEMLVRALGYGILADKAEGYTLPFTDVTQGKGYISVAYDIGMTTGVSATQFAPKATATREQAATMLVRIYEKYHAQTQLLHGFYAISSYSQIGLTSQMDVVSVGWSHMTYSAENGAQLVTKTGDGSLYGIPNSYESAVEKIRNNGAKLYLSVYMDNTGKNLSAMLADADARSQAAQVIAAEAVRQYEEVGASPYSGVTIDFEGLTGSADKANFNAFLTQLDQLLTQENRGLYVAVMPILSQGSYYNGYDYRTIGNLADKVILMAHNYQPTSMAGFLGTEYYKNAALTPLTSVYDSLRAAVDPNTGVSDPDKLILAISCMANAWETDVHGKLVSATPVTPNMQTVKKRLTGGAVQGYSQTYRNPYLTYTTEDGKHMFMWYEDSRSVEEKVTLAKLLGVDNVSLWRLGEIPDDSTAGLYFNVMDAVK